MAPVTSVVETFDTILSLLLVPAAVTLLVLGVYHGSRVVDLARVSNTRSGQLLWKCWSAR